MASANWLQIITIFWQEHSPLWKINSQAPRINRMKPNAQHSPPRSFKHPVFIIMPVILVLLIAWFSDPQNHENGNSPHSRTIAKIRISGSLPQSGGFCRRTTFRILVDGEQFRIRSGHQQNPPRRCPLCKMKASITGMNQNPSNSKFNPSKSTNRTILPWSKLSKNGLSPNILRTAHFTKIKLSDLISLHISYEKLTANGLLKNPVPPEPNHLRRFNVAGLYLFYE